MPDFPSHKEHIGRRTETRKNGTKYIYERRTIYDPETKKIKVLGCKLLGKIPPGATQMIPTRPKKKSIKGPATINARCDDVNAGFATLLADAARESGIEEVLKLAIPEDEAGMILELAKYFCWTGGNLSGFESWQLAHPTLYPMKITTGMLSKLFAEVGEHQDWIFSYFDKQASRHSLNPALALDLLISPQHLPSTSTAIYGSYEEAAQRPVIKPCVLYSEQDQVPVAFTEPVGSILDVVSLKSSLQNLSYLEEVDETNPLVVTDCGFVSESNLIDLMGAHIKFLTLLTLDALWIKESVDQGLLKLGNFSTIYPKNPAITGTVVPRKLSFSYENKVSGEPKKVVEGQLYLYVYRDENIQSFSSRQLYRNVQETITDWEKGNRNFTGPRKRFFDRFFKVTKRGKGKEAKLIVNDYAYKQAVDFMGVFVLASNAPLEMFDALEKYYVKERCERWFDFDKIRDKSERAQTFNANWLSGALFVQFVAFSLYCNLLTDLKKVRNALDEKRHPTSVESQLKIRVDNWLKEFSS